KRRGDF
ncbi:NAD(P) transhydrogenase beta subunit, partial [Vibrio parahaemolyticus VPTS-2010]